MPPIGDGEDLTGDHSAHVVVGDVVQQWTQQQVGDCFGYRDGLEHALVVVHVRQGCPSLECAEHRRHRRARVLGSRCPMCGAPRVELLDRAVEHVSERLLDTRLSSTDRTCLHRCGRPNPWSWRLPGGGECDPGTTRSGRARTIRCPRTCCARASSGTPGRSPSGHSGVPASERVTSRSDRSRASNRPCRRSRRQDLGTSRRIRWSPRSRRSDDPSPVLVHDRSVHAQRGSRVGATRSTSLPRPCHWRCPNNRSPARPYQRLRWRRGSRRRAPIRGRRSP